MMSLLGLFFGVPSAHAAADPVIVNAAADAATAVKENVVAVVTNVTVLSVIIGVPVLIWAIMWVRKHIIGRRK